MTMRIVMITDYPRESNRLDGGVQAVASYLVDELRQVPQLELHVLSLERTAGPYTERQEDGYVRHFIPLARFGTLTAFKRDQRNVDACLSAIEPNLVHAQETSPHGVLAVRSKFPSVVTIHGIKANEARFTTGTRSRLRARVQHEIGTHYYIKQAAHTIIISPYVSDYYGKDLSGEQYFIPNPVASRFFSVARKPVNDRVLFAGRLRRLKGVTDLLHALAVLSSKGRRPYRLILAGSPAEQRYVDELHREARRLGVSDLVEFSGILSSEELLIELSRCTCLALPSYQETSPMVIQEAMASGVPVVASNICGIPYLVDDGETGFLVPPGNIDMLAQKLDKILSNENLCKQFGLASREKANKEYRSSIIAQKTLDVYRRIIS